MNQQHQNPSTLPQFRSEWQAGFTAMLGLWPAALPGALAYVLSAQQAGLDAPATLLLSLLAFSGSAQIGAVGLLALGAPLPIIVLTMAALHLHYLMLGLTLGRRLPLRGWRRITAALLLTEAAFALSAARRRPSFGFLVGAEASMYLAWCGGTLLAVLLGGYLPADLFDGDLVVPLIFATLLVPLLRGRADVIAALTAGGAALVLGPLLPGGLGIVGAGVAGCLAAALLSRYREKEPA